MSTKDSNIVNPGGSTYSLRMPGGVSPASIPSMPMERTLPRQVSTGSMRGTQTVGYGNTKIDGTNNTITIDNPSTNVSISLGVIQGSTSGTGVGFSITDQNSNALFKMDGQTWYWYDATSGKNVMQVGLLPDGTFGFAVAAPGYNVADGYS